MLSYESSLSDTSQHDCGHHQVPSLVFAARSFKAHLDLRFQMKPQRCNLKVSKIAQKENYRIFQIAPHRGNKVLLKKGAQAGGQT